MAAQPRLLGRRGRRGRDVPSDRSPGRQLLDPGDKRQSIQEPLIMAREAPQSPPAAPLNGLPCRGPCEPPRPFLLPVPPPRPLHMLINGPRRQIWTALSFDWRRPLASINCACGVSSAALKGGIKRCESLCCTRGVRPSENVTIVPRPGAG